MFYRSTRRSAFLLCATAAVIGSFWVYFRAAPSHKKLNTGRPTAQRSASPATQPSAFVARSKQLERTIAHAAPASTTLEGAWSSPTSALHNGDRSKPISLEVFPGKIATFFVDQVVQKDRDTWVLRGHTANALSTVVSAKVGKRVAFTVIDPTAGDDYRVVPQGESTRLSDAPRQACGGELVPTSLPKKATIEATTRSFASASASLDDLSYTPSTTKITVAVYYSKALEDHLADYGGIDGIKACAEVGVELMNAALERARANANVQFIGIQKLDFAEDFRNNNGIQTLTTNTLNNFETAFLAAKSAQHLTVLADLNVGVPEAPVSDFGGVAFRPGTESLVMPGELATSSFAHELGHSLGMSHNREDSSDLTHPYAYGFRTSETNPAVCTIMSYSTVHKTVLAYSDPGITFQNVPLGNATTDNARLARESVAAKANTVSSTEAPYVSNAWLVNESTRSYIGTGSDVLIAGLIISGNSPKQVVFRGIGPSLSKYGVQGTLSNPQISLYEAGGALIETNDDWQSGPRTAELQAANLIPADAKEAAIVRTLAPGAYTLILSGANNSVGTGLVEVFSPDAPIKSFMLASSERRLHLDYSGRMLNYQLDPGWGFATDNPKVRMILALSPSPNIHGEIPLGYTRQTFPAIQVRNHPQRAMLQAFTSYATDDMYAVIATKDTDDPQRLLSVWSSPNESGKTSLTVYSLEPDSTQDTAPSGLMGNLSARAIFGVGERSMIAGVIVNGTETRTFVVRALADSLRQYGINNPAKHFHIDVNNSAGLVKRIDAITAEDREVLSARGLLPSSSIDLAALVALAPGAYTFVVSTGSDDDSGVGLLDVNQLN